ncbi:molybdopterin converting factor [Rufibacter radiotolerans]|uniref:Molybdopterin synthase sulfur carrier subunit n=1 Tax=Rufibacter radiotolerans TaxID=1379910 RepID=A0A0H4VP04_9BACT|nr:molybdopterin converting factor subunit 1 [Rufibacter radiotolerans]AKQ45622.1 molybdopterin converting factor [Rufibacter radiotolerans]
MNILLFGITREIVGKQALQVASTPSLETVADLKQWLFAQYPALRELKSLAVAVDSEYAEDAQPLSAGQEIALIPPVSGG